jgi:hypothetical protein
VNDSSAFSDTDRLITALSGVYADAASNTLKIVRSRLQEFAHASYIPDRQRIPLIQILIDRLSPAEKPVAWLEVYDHLVEAMHTHPNREKPILSQNLSTVIRQLPEGQRHQASLKLDEMRGLLKADLT